MYLSRKLVIVLLFVPVVLAQKIEPPADAASRVRAIFARFDHIDSPGCAVGVSIDGAIVLSAAWGMSDLEHNVRLTPDSVFEPGSITKQFTAAAVLLLVQDGKLSLDDPVRRYIPELPDYGVMMTIRHLLNHTSGLRDWGDVADIGGWPRTTRANSNANVLDIAIRQKALNYSPGAEYSYTNTGYNLLAILVGRVAGKSLADFTRERIFLPLGMTSTQWRDDFRRVVPNRAIAYEQTDKIIRQNMPFENAHGNGGLLTTVGDLLRWNRNFTEMKVGGPAFVPAQLQQGRLNDGRTISYASGLVVLRYKGLREIGHSGSTAGYHGWLARYPDQGLSVAVLCNTGAASAEQMGHQIADIYLTGFLPKDSGANFVQIDSESLNAETGMYRSFRDHSALKIQMKEGHLQLGSGTALSPISPRSFMLGDIGWTAEFESDAGGSVTRMRLVDETEGDRYYEKVVPARLPVDLQGIAGEYASEEAEVTLTVALEGDKLIIHRRPDAVIPLAPTYSDGFSSSLGSVRFIRDSKHQVTEMSIGTDRVWDLRLHRIQHVNRP